ncbi:phosphatase PAP2 family protein [Kiloniella laminariae]|uniref:Phosphatase PAP2 family protein n=1 Tax=Kiloniella laminariae TaxID=454162 RepID=A0ABT4LLY3_9PROT|nr:phosphatase PAP2 family protein [Kiloniella laminariae]MCZ4281386.1 phosphatase PAP2 family protein [Kiloniella laminariae]
MPDFLVSILSHLGEVRLFLVATVCIYWIVCPRLGTRLWFALCLSSSLQHIFKMLFAQPRPYWLDPNLTAIEKSTSYGLPSGHAQTPPLFYGLLARSSRKLWAYLLAAAVVLVIGWTRIAGHVHSIEQVLSGWAVGITLLLLIIFLEKPVVRWWTTRNLKNRLTAASGFSALLLAAGLFATQRAAGLEVLELWTLNAGHPIDPVKADNVVLVPGLLFGWLVGLALLDGKHPEKPAKFIRLACRPLIGLPPTALFLLLAPDQNTAVLLTVTFLVGSFTGLWCSYGAPCLFRIFRI